MAPLRPLLPLRRIPLTRSFTTTPTTLLARTQLIGRLASAPELVATPSGREVIRYAVGVEAGPKSAREVSWFRVASFDEGARREFVMGLQKGTLVYVDAESRMRSYEDGEGRRRTQLDLVQQKIDVLARPRAQENGEYGAQEEAMAGAGAEAGDEARMAGSG